MMIRFCLIANKMIIMDIDKSMNMDKNHIYIHIANMHCTLYLLTLNLYFPNGQNLLLTFCWTINQNITRSFNSMIFD